MPAHKIPPDEKLDCFVALRLNRKQADCLKELAANDGKTITSYIRKLIEAADNMKQFNDSGAMINKTAEEIAKSTIAILQSLSKKNQGN